MADNIAIKKMLDVDEQQIFPQTHVKAVIDDNGDTLEGILGNMAFLEDDSESGVTPDFDAYADSVWNKPQELTDIQKANARKNIGLESAITQSIYDISANNGGAEYSGLTEALNAIPLADRKGGMTIQYIDSSCHNYISFRELSTDFSVNISDWQGVDNEPIAGSENLVKSGGVYQKISKLGKKINIYQDSASPLDGTIAELYLSSFYSGELSAYPYPYNNSTQICVQDGYGNVIAKATPVENNVIYPLIVTNSAQSGFPVGMVVGFVLFSDYEVFLASWATLMTSKINRDFVFNLSNAPRIATGIYANNLIPENSLNGDKLLDESVSAEKLSIMEKMSGKNLLDPSKVVTNKWIKANGATDTVTSDYGYYDYIEIEPETQYHISNKDGNALSNRSDCYIAFYDSNKTCITSASVASNTTDITTPTGAAYVRISIVMARVTNKDAQMEKGNTRTEYEPYEAPSLKIEKQYIQLPDEITITAKPNQFNGWSNSSDSIAAGGQLLIADKVFRSRKGFQYCCVVNGAIDNIRLLIGDLYIDVTSTSFSVNGGTAQVHGLTPGTITTFILNCGNDKNITSNTTFRIINDAGATYEKTGLDFRIFNGSVGIKNNNSVTAIGAKVNVFNKDLPKKIWMFGDSYFSYIDPSRWVYYLMQWGYINYFLNAMSGENATQALNDLNMLLESGCVPSYIVWCLGMNDAADSGGSVNLTWMEKTNALIAICKAKGIQPIFATIPSVPSISHVALNNWVRNSGYRYVDFAASVENAEQGGNNYWRLWGDDPTTPNAGSLLSSDKVHPTQYGAVELAARFLADFPEITVLDN
jgi:lysophospholipase L1-like esterase